MRSIPFRWSLLGVALIAIVVYGGAGHDHTVFLPSCRTCPVRPSRLLWSSTDSEAAHQRTIMLAASSPMYSPEKVARRIPRLGQCESIAPGREKGLSLEAVASTVPARSAPSVSGRGCGNALSGTYSPEQANAVSLANFNS
jgi:hypothetical protein